LYTVEIDILPSNEKPALSAFGVLNRLVNRTCGSDGLKAEEGVRSGGSRVRHILYQLKRDNSCDEDERNSGEQQCRDDLVTDSSFQLHFD